MRATGGLPFELTFVVIRYRDTGSFINRHIFILLKGTFIVVFLFKIKNEKCKIRFIQKIGIQGLNMGRLGTNSPL